MKNTIILALVISLFLFIYNWFGIDPKYLVYALTLIFACVVGALVAHAWRDEE